MPQQHAQRPGKGNKQGKPNNKQRRESLTAFLDPLTPKTFRKELRAERRLALRPQQRELQGEVRAEKAYRPRIRDYFANYGQAVQQAAGESASAFTDAYNRATAAGTAASATDQAVRDRIEAEARADAERRGATYTPSTQSLDASANRGDSAAGIAAVIAGQGANQAAYLADKSRIGQGEKRDQLLKSHARSRSLDADKRDLATAKRDFAIDYTARARDAERSYAIQRAQLRNTRKGAKLSAKTSRANAQLSAATTRRGQNLTRRSAAESHAETARHNAEIEAHNAAVERRQRREDRYQRRHPSSSGGGDGKNVQNAAAYLRNYGNSLDRHERQSFTRQAAIDYLVAHGYPRDVAVAAVDRVTGSSHPGHTSPNAALHGG